ncbi:bromodomain-containing protein 8 [Condylostylus longicornis]|uniref:bromodomain-containing protein 8 n=1 Tax=Condylostylus longicornis TaxID=2530218 RepID=UPI00244E0CF1|nr:bromodomain-containing protein 8 [Condylostylus longicornis]
MTSVQERLQIKRTALDKWSIKERLCLASAVHCSGDQNWMSVSRSLKLLCSSHNRPPDWFSQKSCAVQYGELLENVETPKRKKRTNSDNQNQPAETPTESILRNLKQERVTELEALIQKERDVYIKLHKDAISLQNNTATDEQIRELWLQIQKEKEHQIVEEQKYNDWLKEREQRKLELQRAWRPTFTSNLNANQTATQTSQGTNLKHEDMDIDETITPISSTMIASSKPQQTATSPLLTSLLKTPSPTIGPATVTHTSSTPSARVQAPTITNLLTGGQLPPNTTCHQQYKISHPVTGPPIHMTNVPQVVQSPSQAAPTLSMLLENKNLSKENSSTNLDTEDKSQSAQQSIEQEGDGSDSPNKDELMEVFKGLIDENIDENIDELAEILTNNNAIIPEILDEALENVDLEEQLNPENDENVLLNTVNEEKTEGTDSKNVNETFANENKVNIKSENDPENPELKIKTENTDNIGENSAALNVEPVIKEQKDDSPNSVQFVETKEEPLDEIKPTIKSEESGFKQIETENDKEDKKSDISEDSGDITFQEIANEIKEKIKAEEGQDSKESSDDVMEITDNLQGIQSGESEDKKSIFTFEDSQDTPITKSEGFRKLQTSTIKESSKKSISESSDIIIIPEDEDSVEKNKKENEGADNNKLSFSEKTDLPQKSNVEKTPEDIKSIKNEGDKNKKLETTTITIIDTDDDSTHTDTLIKEEKIADNFVPKSNLKREMLQEKPEVEDKKQPPEEDNKNLVSKKIIRGEQEDSENAPAEDELNDSMPRTRRRFSSTPVMDSVPNSPASSVEINDQKVWKKSILAVYAKLLSNKNSSLFLRTPSEEQAPKYRQIILHPLDLQTIKKNIDNNIIKSTNEFQRDLMLMCINAIMFCEQNSDNFVAAVEFLAEIRTQCSKLTEKENKKESDDTQDISISTTAIPTNISLSSTPSSSSKMRSRKSQRF